MHRFFNPSIHYLINWWIHEFIKHWIDFLIYQFIINWWMHEWIKEWRFLTCDVWSTIYTLHPQDRVPKKILRFHILLHEFAFGAFFSQNSLACGTFFLEKTLVCWVFDFSALFGLTIHWYWKRCEFKYSVITATQFVNTNNQESVELKTLCQENPREMPIAQHQFNSRTDYKH